MLSTKRSESQSRIKKLNEDQVSMLQHENSQLRKTIRQLINALENDPTGKGKRVIMRVSRK